MATYTFAPVITSHSFTTGNLTATVASGNPVDVYGIHIFNNSGGALTYTVKDGDGNTIWVFNVATLGHESVECPFKAGNGLQITASGATGYVVVFHTNPGL